MRFTIALALAFVLALGGIALATTSTTTTTTTTTLVKTGCNWTIIGEVSNNPGQALHVPFSCKVTDATPTCDMDMPNIGLVSFARSADHNKFSLVFAAPTCTPLDVSDDSKTRNLSVGSSAPYSGSETFRAYLPCFNQ